MECVPGFFIVAFSLREKYPASVSLCEREAGLNDGDGQDFNLMQETWRLFGRAGGSLRVRDFSRSEKATMFRIVFGDGVQNWKTKRQARTADLV